MPIFGGSHLTLRMLFSGSNRANAQSLKKIYSWFQPLRHLLPRPEFNPNGPQKARRREEDRTKSLKLPFEFHMCCGMYTKHTCTNNKQIIKIGGKILPGVDVTYLYN